VTGPDVLADELEQRLAALGTAERAEKEKAYLKSDLAHLGVSVPATRRATRDVVGALPTRTHDDVVALAGALWSRPVHECRMSAVEVLELGVGGLGPDDLPLLEAMLRDARTWALVDGLSASVVGALVERHPQLGDTLDRWVTDDDVWLRRSALLALLVPLRRGDGDPDRFFRYADALLADRSFWVRKAIGWVLRDTARRRPALVADWLAPRAARAAGLTVREAVKPLPPEQRDAILTAHRAGR
jgi:3-methyladenine DNA glycosylase AlkD